MSRKGEMTVEEAGRRGGSTRAQQQEGTREGELAKAQGKMTVQEAGKRGGEAVREKFGPEGYSEIGKMGAEERAKRDEMHEFADEAEARVPQQYKDVRQEAFDRTVNIAKVIIPEASQILLKAGFSASEARSKIESDFGQIWRPRTISRWLPTELKDAERALAGQMGGEETGRRKRGRPRKGEEATKEAWEEGQRRGEERLAEMGAAPSAARPSTNKFRIYSDDFEQLRRAMERAIRMSVEYIEIEIDKEWHVTWIEIPESRTAAA